MSANTPHRAGNLVSIQLLRAIAAVVVVFGHAQTEAWQANSNFDIIKFDFGIGVDIFFIISGFIMVLASSKLVGKPGASFEFMKKRFFRVVPLYWLYSALMILAILIFPNAINNADLNLQMIISSFLFFPYPNALGHIQPVLALGWTLNYEVFFYLVFAVSLLNKNRRWMEVTWAILLLVMVCGATSDNTALNFWGNPIIGEFIFGVVLGNLFKFHGKNQSLLLFLMCIITSFTMHFILRDNLGVRVITHGLPSLVFVIGFVFFLPTSAEETLRRVTDYLGDSSYSLYLSHPFFLAVSKMIWGRVDPSFQFMWTYVFVGTLGSIAIGYVAYLIIEKPTISFSQKNRSLQIY